MADLKIRMYIGSVAAVAATGESYEFEPFCLLLDSLESAASEARKYVYQRWPVTDGWHDHAATIAPLPGDMYKLFGDAAAANLLDIQEPTETQTGYKFHPDPVDLGPQTIH